MKAIAHNINTYILYDGDAEAGRIIYRNFFSSAAQFSDTENNHFEFRPLNFVKNRFEVRYENKPLITVKRKWRGAMVLSTHFSEASDEYVFRRKAFFSRIYVLIDKDGRTLAVVRTGFNLKKLKRDYRIEAMDSLKRKPQCLLMIATITYLMRIIRRKRSAHAG